MDQIVIQQLYFDNIQKAVESINEFFASNFETKNFPTDRSNLEFAITWIIDILNDLDPVYVKSQDTVDTVTQDILQKIGDMNEINIQNAMMDRTVSNALDAIVAYIALQTISENFELFTNLINGIYSFDIFLHPSKYRQEIDLFSDNIQMPAELEDIGMDVAIFPVDEYIENLINGCALIKFPDDIDVETEKQRMHDFRDSDAKVVISKSNEITEFYHMEAATEKSDMIVAPKAIQIKYDKKEDKFVITQQFQSFIDKLMKGIRECNTVAELKTFFESAPNPDILFKNVCPFILTQAYEDDEIYTGNVDRTAIELFDSIYLKKMKEDGAKRFKNYDIFTTFKADKDGTIKFIEDFLTLKLATDKNCAITNNVLLAIFNIFDSRLYFDTLYNLLPNDKRKEQTEDEFVKEIRARINKNSRASNMYQPELKKETDDTVMTSDEVKEYVYDQLAMFGDMTVMEMSTCRQYGQMLYDEIDTLGDAIYNNRMSPSRLDTIAEEFVPYKKKGDIPTYMKSRMSISDEEGADIKSEPPATEIPDPVIPPPENSIEDLANSVESKMGMDGNLDDVIGQGFEENPDKKNAQHITYNITYNNSFNKTSNDLSTTTTTNDLSTGKTVKTVTAGRDYTSTKTPSNNYSNSADSVDTKESKKTSPSDGRKFSNGMSVQEMFAFLESEEPLSSEVASVKKGNTAQSLTDSMKKSKRNVAEKQAKAEARKAKRAEKGGPVTRVKDWLKDVVNSLIQRDEDQVKTEIIESPSYRSTLFKAGRAAVKLGLVGVAFTISGWVGAATLGVMAARHADRVRLRREVSEEFMTEIKIIDEKIEYIKHHTAYSDDPAKRKELYQLMRLRNQMAGILADTQRNRWRNQEAYNKTRW